MLRFECSLPVITSMWQFTHPFVPSSNSYFHWIYIIHTVFFFLLKLKLFMSHTVFWITTTAKDVWCSPDQVHTKKGLSGGDGLSGPDRLIPNTDSLVIGAHFRAPHPSRFSKDDSVSLLYLRDLDVCALQVKNKQTNIRYRGTERRMLFIILKSY